MRSEPVAVPACAPVLDSVFSTNSQPSDRMLSVVNSDHVVLADYRSCSCRMSRQELDDYWRYCRQERCCGWCLNPITDIDIENATNTLVRNLREPLLDCICSRCRSTAFGRSSFDLIFYTCCGAWRRLFVFIEGNSANGLGEQIHVRCGPSMMEDPNGPNSIAYQATSTKTIDAPSPTTTTTSPLQRLIQQRTMTLLFNLRRPSLPSSEATPPPSYPPSPAVTTTAAAPMVLTTPITVTAMMPSVAAEETTKPPSAKRQKVISGKGKKNTVIISGETKKNFTIIGTGIQSYRGCVTPPVVTASALGRSHAAYLEVYAKEEDQAKIKDMYFAWDAATGEELSERRTTGAKRKRASRSKVPAASGTDGSSSTRYATQRTKSKLPDSTLSPMDSSSQDPSSPIDEADGEQHGVEYYPPHLAQQQQQAQLRFQQQQQQQSYPSQQQTNYPTLPPDVILQQLSSNSNTELDALMHMSRLEEQQSSHQPARGDPAPDDILTEFFGMGSPGHTMEALSQPSHQFIASVGEDMSWFHEPYTNWLH